MQKLRTIIAEDEPIARDFMKGIIDTIDEVELLAICPNGKIAFDTIIEQKPQLAILDIHMPKMSGIEIVKSLSQSQMPMIIFVTAYDKYAISAFEASAIDYVLKPIDKERVTRAIKRAIERMKEKNAIAQLRDRVLEILSNENLLGNSNNIVEKPVIAKKEFPAIQVRENGLNLRIEQDNIIWIEAAGDFVCFHVQTKNNGIKTFVKRISITKLILQLDDEIFKRIHRSRIVNINYIEKFSSLKNGMVEVKLKDNSTHKFSQTYSDIADFLINNHKN
ncbi:MAG: response regulator transcription factor [Caulobacterales bacterium]|nr:response regulator transcription factor [Caulobacterales bacterium]